MDGTVLNPPAPAEVHPHRGGPLSARWLRLPVYAWLKPGLDWSGALVLLIAAAPVIGGLALAVRLTSKGPAFYSQVRLGRFGRPFRIYKLRTMTHGCETGTGPVWSGSDDPRVTRIGRWLRDTHLDEAPQLWNVLRGEMSLIGPRPERPEIAAKIERSLPEFRGRLLVRPGITGLAQMRLPADSDLGSVAAKLAHDLAYVRGLSAGLDARIALSTLLHFVGWAATVLSRQLVAPFAPAIHHRPGAAPEIELPVAGRITSATRSAAESGGLSRAA